MIVMLRLLAVLVVFTTAQTSAQQPPPAPPDPPAGDNAWSLLVSSTGGITGRGLGTVTVVSDGSASCVPTACATPVEATRLKRISTSLSAVAENAWITRAPSATCSDCMQTTITLKQRRKDGIRTSVASWDDSQNPAPELRELRRLVFELRTASSPTR
jgi:hypothetical protein